MKQLPSDLPHVAYILLWYPLFTQPFIFREVEELRKRLPLDVYTLYGLNLKHCSAEMQAVQKTSYTLGSKALLKILAELFRQLCTHPVRLARLFRRLIRHWPSWEILGENLWAFCAGVYLGRLFLEAGIDLIYAPWPRGTATAAWTASAISGLPFAMSARGDNLNPADPDLQEKMSDALFIRANNLADQRRLEQFKVAQNKTFLIYNSLTLPAQAQTISEVKSKQHTEPLLRLLAVGRFDVTKGFDVLLQACALLKKENLPFKLTLVGGGGKIMGLGDLADKLQNLRTTLHLEDCVEMPGFISHNELPQILGTHDLFVAPCVIDASGKRDGIPNTVIEAMSFGLPVVGTNVNALPEVIHDQQTGLLVPPGDPEALAQAVKVLWQNPQLLHIFGANARKLAEEMFDPQKNSQRMQALFVDNYRRWKNLCAE